MQVSGEKLNITLDVTKIEVKAIVKPGEDDSDTTFFRTFRFTTYDGEVLEVFCTAGYEEYVQIQEVEALP